MNNKFIGKAKRVLAGFVAAATAVTMLPTIPAMAEDLGRYPYTLFAASSADGAITTTASNFCVNGNIATNGTISATGNMNINGTKTENANQDMIYILDKIDSKYFSGNNVEERSEDYAVDEININISKPTEVLGEAELTGNININTALKAFKDITLNGEVKNANDSVIYSKYGDIVIDSTNVNLNGLVYAPFGSVEVKADNLNLNSVVIIADSISFDCPNINANYSTNVADFVGNVSEPLNIPKDEWQYMKDENENGLPDFFEDFENWSKLADTDGDGLPDSIEEYLGSDTNKIDTDGDGLNDYYEVFSTFTDPTKADTDDNGVNDGNEDFDEDGLTNLEEFANQTNPHIADTDSDGLSDNDEVNTYGTNPIVADTDGDGLDDGDEIALGTNPLVQDTDGDGIIDSKEKIHQKFTHKVKNEDCAVTEVSVDMECTGNINKTTSVESIMNTDILCTDVVGLVGEPFEIKTDSEFDKATLTFKIDKDKLGETPFDNLLFLWYNEEENRFDELETVLDADSSSVSIVTPHFSKYMVVDSQAWFDNWRKIYDRFENLLSINPSITAICVDCSGSMSWNDPDFKADDNPTTCYRNLAVQKFAEAMFERDKTSIITFDSYAREVCPLTSDKETIKSKARFSSYGGTNANSAINIALQELKTAAGNASIILMSDGDVNVTDANIETAIKNRIKIHSVALGAGANSAALKQYADKTGGEFFIVKTAAELELIYDKLSANNQLNFNYLSDTDGDGVPDDIEISGIPMPNGNLVFTDPNVRDTDGDDLTDGEEVGKMSRDPSNPMSTPEQAVVYKFRFNVTSDPTLIDSDYDGKDDIKENIRKRMNNYFLVTWNPDTEKNDVQYKDIIYTMDYSQFFNRNTEYNSKLSTVSSLMAGLAYDKQSLVVYPDETEDYSHVDQFLHSHGMYDEKTYKLAERYNDQHITDVTFGHRLVKYNGQIKEIIAVVIRGTNGTVEEWSSNFDIGCDSIYEGKGLIPKNEDWEIKENHMGFDITATRVIKLLDEYLSQAENLDNSAKKALWITGHSRGAAISNILGSRLDSKYETFVYTFATPRTTTVSEEIAKSHKSIFNIINGDDIITDMPLKDKWGFNHYGEDIIISVAENYSNVWESYTTKSYVSSQEKKKELLDSFGTLADDRNDCYEFHCSCHGDGTSNYMYTVFDDPNNITYGENYCICDSHWYHYNVEELTRCETTAYFMQFLAVLAAKGDFSTLITDVAKNFEDTKHKFVDYSSSTWVPFYAKGIDNISNPHEPISYYVLALESWVNDD